MTNDATITTLNDALRAAGLASTEAEREQHGTVRVILTGADPDTLATRLLLTPGDMMPWDLHPLGIRPVQSSVMPDRTTFYLTDEDALRLAVLVKDTDGVTPGK